MTLLAWQQRVCMYLFRSPFGFVVVRYCIFPLELARGVCPGITAALRKIGSGIGGALLFYVIILWNTERYVRQRTMP